MSTDRYPIACSLTEAQLAERRRTVLDSIRNDVVRVVRLPLGYAYDFPDSSEMLERVQQLVELDRGCCGFLTFEIHRTDSAVRLEITGPTTVIPIIANLFGDGDAP